MCIEKSCNIKAGGSLILVPMISPFHLKPIVSDVRVLTMATVFFQERFKISQRWSPSDVEGQIEEHTHTQLHNLHTHNYFHNTQ